MGAIIKTRLFLPSRPSQPISAMGAIWLFDHIPDEINEPNFLDCLRSSFVNALTDLPHWAGQLQWAPVRQGDRTPNASTGPSSSMAAKRIPASNGVLCDMPLCRCSRWHQTL